MNILVIDNYDSFVYNLVHLLRELGHTPQVFRNNKISLEAVAQYDKILLSPGPGVPAEAGIMPELLQTYGPTKSIFGVCLGCQAIGEAYGSTLNNLPQVLHGLSDQLEVQLPENRLFKGLPSHFQVGHYHSWVIDPATIDPQQLEVSALDSHGNVMAVSHRHYDVHGVQFHPESVLTEHGAAILTNWLKG